MAKRIVWISILVIILGIQFIPTNRPEVVLVNKKDLLSNNVFSDSITKLIKNTCYDCHSNQTNYPWYSYVAPVSWLVIKDVRDGRGKMNFSEWESLSKMDKAEHLTNINDEVSYGSMPLKIYPIMHSKARLSVKDRQLLVDWTDQFGEALYKK